MEYSQPPVQMRYVGPISGNSAYTFIPQFAHVNLQGEQSKDHETEYSQGHDLGQLAKGMKQCIDDGLQAGHNGNGFQCAEDTKCSQAGKIANFHANCRISAGDDHKVQPIPWIPQIRILVEQKAFGNDFDYHFNRVNG